MSRRARSWTRIGTFLFLLAIVPPFAAFGVEHHLWLLDEGQGDVAVDSGSIGYDMQVVAPDWQDDGPFPEAGSLHLDGSGKNYAFLERRISGASGTLEMWIKPKRVTGPLEWRDVDLTPYVGKEVFVRFSNPTDKGQCRVKQWRLITTPATDQGAR